MLVYSSEWKPDSLILRGSEYQIFGPVMNKARSPGQLDPNAMDHGLDRTGSQTEAKLTSTEG